MRNPCVFVLGILRRISSTKGHNCIDLVDCCFQPGKAFNSLRPRQNCRHFALDTFKRFLFPRPQLTIVHHWCRCWLGAGQATSEYLNQWWLVYWRIYASLGLNELNTLRTYQWIEWSLIEIMACQFQCYVRSNDNSIGSYYFPLQKMSNQRSAIYGISFSLYLFKHFLFKASACTGPEYRQAFTWSNDD